MTEVYKKIVKNKLSLVITIIFLVLLAFFTSFYDIGLNSKYFVKKDFTEAFLLRQTGDCEEFVKYLNQDWANWDLRCYQEKSSVNSIKNFKIKNITINGARSFLQVELLRNKDSYVVNYEMVRSKGRWFIDQRI